VHDADEKVSKASVDYSPGMKSAHCAICRNYRTPDACVRVAGAIDPEYWCKLFAKA
jgi:hypothetical protein